MKASKLPTFRRSLPRLPMNDANKPNNAKENKLPDSLAGTTTPSLSLTPEPNRLGFPVENVTPVTVSVTNGTKPGLSTPKDYLKIIGLKHSDSKLGTPLTPECYNKVILDSPKNTPLRHRNSVGTLDTFKPEKSASVTVAVRVRPFNQREIDRGHTKLSVSMKDNETIVTSDTGAIHNFFYDYCFWSFKQSDSHFAGQQFVYEKLARPLLTSAFEGYNTCLFAYGQTGSGKSYSIMGEQDNAGIVPRFSEELFCRIDNPLEEDVIFNTEISYFEIYNEKIHDLLASSKDKGKKKVTLRVREHPVLGPYVEGLSTFVAKSYDDITGWLALGNKQRATASTGMNDKSSRSHSVFTIVLTQKKTEMIEGEAHEHSRTSRINLIDLAGSERCTSAETTGTRLREGASINKSLHTLGKVISSLSERSMHKKKKVFIPYRDSVLTWLLKESLGGNSKTSMIATIGPSNRHFEETMSTLRYAKQARTIVNIAKINEDPSARLIRELRAEIEKLKGQTNGGTVSENDYLASLGEIASLKERLQDSELAMAEATKTWKDKLAQSERSKIEESRELERAGVAFKIDNTLPNLVNLNEDPQLSEVLLYLLKAGVNRVGHMEGDSQHEIQLSGALVGKNHCNINNVDNIVTITPLDEAQTYVNGSLIEGPTVLHHGDRLVIGDHYFRVNHPHEVKSGRRKSTAGMPIDFEFAKNELITQQNTKLEVELEEARLKAQEEIMIEIQKAKETAQREMDNQKNDYENRMTRLEQQLQKESEGRELEERIKQEAEEKIFALEEQKRMLEQEVNANRKRLQMEAVAARQALDDTKCYQARILQELDSEKKRIARDVERLQRVKKAREEEKAKRGSDYARRSSRRDLLRLSMWLQEANNISKSLKKRTMFSRHDEIDGDEVTFKVRLNNTKLGITTFWTLDKFEDRLIQMRELYQQGGGPDSNSDDLFYDASDQWEKDYEMENSPAIPSTSFTSLRTPGSVSRLSSFSSRASSIGSTPASLSHFSPRRRVLSSVSSRASVYSSSSSSSQSPIPIHHLCRKLLTTSLERFHNTVSKEQSIVDSILSDMHKLKSAIEQIRMMRNKASGDDCCTDCGNAEDLASSVMESSSATDLLLSHVSIWSSYHVGLDSGLIQDLTEQMVETTKKVAGNVVKMIQGCENDIDSMVSESYKQLEQTVDFLAKIIGELAIATETDMTVLNTDSNSNEEQISASIKQGFLDGVDVFIDRTVQGTIRTVSQQEAKVNDFQGIHATEFCNSMLKKLLMIVLMVRVELSKCQDVQVELASTFSNISTDSVKSSAYYVKHYQRAHSIITESGNMADSVNSLCCACLAVAKGQRADPRQLKRYIATVTRTSSKLCQAMSVNEIINNVPEDQSDSSDTSSSSSTTEFYITEQVAIATREVDAAANSLVDLIDSELGKLFPPVKGAKRLLPASPEVSHLNRIRKRLNIIDYLEHNNI